jgi:hypothetical protein
MGIGVTLGAGTMFKSVYDPDLDNKFGFPVIPSGMDVFWQIRSSAADNPWISVTYGNGLFVAVAYTGVGNRVMTSPDGITWTIRSSAADNSWYSVTYGNGLFVAVANTGSGNRVMTSPDGITWTIRSSAADNAWYSVTYGNGVFVAVANTGVGNRVMTLSSGKNVLDPDDDGKVKLAQLNNVAHTLDAEVLVFFGVVPQSSRTSTTYAMVGNRGFACFKGGDYKFGAAIKTSNGSYTCYLGYRINGGSWVQIDTTTSTSLVWKTMGAAITLNDGDTVEIGIKGASASYNAYIESYKILMSKVNKIE